MRVVQSFTREPVNQTSFRGISDRYREANYETVVLNGLYFPAVDFLSSVATAISCSATAAGSCSRRSHHGRTLLAFTLYLSNFFDPVRQLSQLYQRSCPIAALDRIVGLRRGAGRGRRSRRRQADRIRGRVHFDAVTSFEGRAPRCSTASSWTSPWNDHNRPRRPYGRRQIDDRQAARTLLRPAPGGCNDRRSRHARGDAGVPTAAARDRAAGGIPVGGPWRRTSRSGARMRPGRRSARWRRRSASASRPMPKGTAGLGERGYRLSLGQRGSPSRALLADPRILILDEATSSVDIGTERQIERALRRLLAGRTRTVIAHRLSTIRDADLIVVLEHGRVIEQGTHELSWPGRACTQPVRGLGRRSRVDCGSWPTSPTTT